MKTRNWRLAVVSSMLVILVSSKAAGRDDAALVEGAAAQDPSGTHNMLVVGRNVVFLSHLPMFDGLNEKATDYTSLHRYQLILEVSFTENGKDVTDLYTNDRQANLGTKMYTLSPEPFVLARLFTSDAQGSALSSFKAKVFRGHLERPGHQVVNGLEDVIVMVKKVVYAQKFDPAATKPERLQYFLFGKGGELFLAHAITKPPDFDQIVSVNVSDHSFTDQELNRGISVLFRDRSNAAPQRLKENQQAQGHFQVTAADQGFDLAVQAGTEYYFEEGELAMPPRFKQTQEEAESGF
jgi:hypothetical protein